MDDRLYAGAVHSLLDVIHGLAVEHNLDFVAADGDGHLVPFAGRLRRMLGRRNTGDQAAGIVIALPATGSGVAWRIGLM